MSLLLVILQIRGEEDSSFKKKMPSKMGWEAGREVIFPLLKTMKHNKEKILSAKKLPHFQNTKGLVIRRL